MSHAINHTIEVEGLRDTSVDVPLMWSGMAKKFYVWCEKNTRAINTMKLYHMCNIERNESCKSGSWFAFTKCDMFKRP